MAAIQEQAARLCTIAPQHANDVRGQAASLIVDRAPEGFSHVFFTNGGTEAVEHAVRMARLHTGRHKVLSRYRSYHGGTLLSGVSSKLNYLVVGEDAGSKLAKAKKIPSITVLTEDEFLGLIG